MQVTRECVLWSTVVIGVFKVILSTTPGLNEELVQLLLIRDELHMEQDAMLVDIEDLTRSESLNEELTELHLLLFFYLSCVLSKNLFKE